jgi:hypothetical protein
VSNACLTDLFLSERAICFSGPHCWRCPSVFLAISGMNWVVCRSVARCRELWRLRQLGWRCHAPPVFIRIVVQTLDELVSIRYPAGRCVAFTSETSRIALPSWLVTDQILAWACCKFKWEALSFRLSGPILPKAIWSWRGAPALAAPDPDGMNPIGIWKSYIVAIKSLNENDTTIINIFFRIRIYGGIPRLPTGKNFIQYEIYQINADHRKGPSGVPLAERNDDVIPIRQIVDFDCRYLETKWETGKTMQKMRFRDRKDDQRIDARNKIQEIRWYARVR